MTDPPNAEPKNENAPNKILIEAFLNFLKDNQGPVPLSELSIFIENEGYADKYSVEQRVRSVMRKIRGDPRFLFFGTTRDRHISFNREAENQKTLDQNMAEIVEYMLKKSMLKGSDIEYTLGESSIGDESEEEVMLSLIKHHVFDRSPNGYQWSSNNFIGFETGNKRSSALSLPHRTWNSLDEIQNMLHSLFESEVPYIWDDIRQFPILCLLLKRQRPFLKSELFEVAIEHLRCTILQLLHKNEDIGVN
jgi:hypothetical protein